MTMALDDQVWREDIEELRDIARDGAKVLNDYMKRMNFQRAPPELVAKAQKARDLFAETADELTPLIGCFPPSR